MCSRCDFAATDPIPTGTLCDDIKRIADACDDRDDTLSDDAYRDECAMRAMETLLRGKTHMMGAVARDAFDMGETMVNERAERRQVRREQDGAE